jgi:hypothetical protein
MASVYALFCKSDRQKHEGSVIAGVKIPGSQALFCRAQGLQKGFPENLWKCHLMVNLNFTEVLNK